MGANNASYVVSFSIVILLLVLLLLLLTYNSKCSMNTQQQQSYFENFENGRSVADNHNKGINVNKASSGFGNIRASEADNEVFSQQNLMEHFYESNPPIDDIVKNVKKPSNVQSSGAGGAGGAGGSTGAPTANMEANSEGFYNFSPAAEEKQSPEFQACFPRDRLTANDLLPKDAADSKWARLNPSGTGDIHDQNYLTAGYHIGVNTIGQTLRNANLQLRSEIPNPQTPVGPWMISTIEPDLRTNTLEIGSAPSY